MLELLLALASQLSGYPLPQQMPTLEYRSAAWLEARTCPSGSAARCTNVHGLYLDHGNVIYLDERLRAAEHDPVTRSLVLHELVHFLQDHAGLNADDCNQRQAREFEAYRLQQAFLHGEGFTTRLHFDAGDCPISEAATAAQGQ
ncbi:MAG: DUF6647 family protein [Pseudomonadota bacterium]